MSTDVLLFDFDLTPVILLHPRPEDEKSRAHVTRDLIVQVRIRLVLTPRLWSSPIEVHMCSSLPALSGRHVYV